MPEHMSPGQGRWFEQCLTLKPPRITVFYDDTHTHRTKDTRACACVYLSQHLDGSLMTLTFRGGRGRMKKRRMKKLLSNFVARAYFLKNNPPFLTHFDIFSFLYVSGKLILYVIYEICVSVHASWDLWSLHCQCCRSDRK